MKKRNKTCFLICSVVIFLGGYFFHTNAIIFSADELLVPTITINPDIYYPMDEILYLEGRAQPNANVQIQFQKQGAKPMKFNSKSDSNGEWVLAEKVPLEAGDWEVRARIIGEKDSSRRTDKDVCDISILNHLLNIPENSCLNFIRILRSVN